MVVAGELTVALTCTAMDSDLDDILNDGPVSPAAPSAAAAPASANAPPQPAPSATPSPDSPEVEKAPDVGKPTQEPIVEAAPMSTESAVLVSAPDMGEDSEDETSSWPVNAPI